VSHTHLLCFLEHRIGDPNFLRIVRRLRRAGGKAMMDYLRRHLEGPIRY
jgi:hypothetical protein